MTKNGNNEGNTAKKNILLPFIVEAIHCFGKIIKYTIIMVQSPTIAMFKFSFFNSMYVRDRITIINRDNRINMVPPKKILYIIYN